MQINLCYVVWFVGNLYRGRIFYLVSGSKYGPGDFFLSIRQVHVPGVVDSASKNEYQGIPWGKKAAGT